MDTSIVDIIFNNGIAVGVLIWFMFKNKKDMEMLKAAMRDENKMTSEALSELKVVIAKVGGLKDE